jgi:hypothetical protein
MLSKSIGFLFELTEVYHRLRDSAMSRLAHKKEAWHIAMHH